jgi:hypothetical protein
MGLACRALWSWVRRWRGGAESLGGGVEQAVAAGRMSQVNTTLLRATSRNQIDLSITTPPHPQFSSTPR